MSELKRYDFDTDEACTRIRFGEMADGAYVKRSDVEPVIAERDQYQRIYNRASTDLCAIGELLDVPEDDQSTSAILDAIKVMRQQLDTEAANHAETLVKLGEMDQQLLRLNDANDAAADHQIALNTTIHNLERQNEHVRKRRRYWIAESCKAESKLADAEQRNAILASTLEECITEMSLALQDHAVRSAMTVIGRTRFLKLVHDFNTKSTESGASE